MNQFFTSQTLALLARCNWAFERYSEAAALNEESLRIERRHPDWSYTPRVLRARAYDHFVLGEYAKAVELEAESLELYQRRYGPRGLSTLDGMVNLVNTCGAMGSWLRVVSLCREILQSTDDLASVSRAGLCGATAALLAGDTNAYRELAAQELARFAGTTNTDWARVVLEVCLLMPDSVPDPDAVFSLVDRVPPGGPGLNWNRIAKGMAAYRRGNLLDALKWFEGWRHCATSTAASQAGYFSAMVHFRQRDATMARAELSEAGKRLASSLHSGELGTSWHEYGRVAVIRAEAERLILGKEVSSRIDAAWLESARKQWEPVRLHLNHGDRLAEQKKWSEARDEYLAAIREPVFEWEAAENAALGSRLATRIGITFVLAKDLLNHQRLCERLLLRFGENPDSTSAYHALKGYLAGEVNVTNALGQTALKLCGTLEHDPGNVSPDAIGLIRAMAAYRSSRYEEVVEQSKAADKSRLAIRSAAQIFRAMALAKLGRWAEGKKELQQADSNLSKHLTHLSGDVWWDLALCQLALDEAHRLFGNTK